MNVLYSDYVKSKAYKQAQMPHRWLLENAPDLNASIYINGAVIYDNLQEKEKDEARKLVLQDSALLMYDLRMKYFNDEKEVLNRKGFYIYTYYKDRKNLEAYELMYRTLKKAFDLNGHEIWTNNLVAFMDAARRYKILGGVLSDEEILDTYEEVIEIIDYKESQGEDKDRLEKYRKNVDIVFANTITLSCEDLESKIGSQLTDDGFDKAYLYLRLARAKQCTDNPSYLRSIKIVHKHKPEMTWAKYIAMKSKGDKDYDEAEKYFNEALTLATDDTQKAEIYLNLADLAAVRGSKSTARGHAYKALELDPEKKDAYSVIGRLYMRSFDDCAQKQDIVKDRAVYFAAHEMFRKAGDTDGMRNAAAQFPTMTDIFTQNYQVGQSINTGCWINETVTIQKNPN